MAAKNGELINLIVEEKPEMVCLTFIQMKAEDYNLQRLKRGGSPRRRVLDRELGVVWSDLEGEGSAFSGWHSSCEVAISISLGASTLKCVFGWWIKLGGFGQPDVWYSA